MVQAQTPSALESDPKGWQNLFADKTMKDWARGPMGAVGQLPVGNMDGPSPWKLDPATGILLCEGDKAGHEWLRFATEVADVVYHVEWRLTNSRVSLPTTAECSSEAVPTGRSGTRRKAPWRAASCSGPPWSTGPLQRFNLRQPM